jgi:hypothetical protein
MKSPMPELSMQEFRKAVETYFYPFAAELGTEWQVVCPWIEGFAAPKVQVTIGVYHGHSPSMFVKFRSTSSLVPLGTDDSGVYGLDWVQIFVSGEQLPYVTQEVLWAEGAITKEIIRLSKQFRMFAMPLLRKSGTDWMAIETFVHESIVNRESINGTHNTEGKNVSKT